MTQMFSKKIILDALADCFLCSGGKEKEGCECSQCCGQYGDIVMRFCLEEGQSRRMG